MLKLFDCGMLPGLLQRGLYKREVVWVADVLGKMTNFERLKSSKFLD